MFHLHPAIIFLWAWTLVVLLRRLYGLAKGDRSHWSDKWLPDSSMDEKSGLDDGASGRGGGVPDTFIVGDTTQPIKVN